MAAIFDKAKTLPLASVCVCAPLALDPSALTSAVHLPVWCRKQRERLWLYG